MTDGLETIVQLGAVAGTVAVVLLFLWYLRSEREHERQYRQDEREDRRSYEEAKAAEHKAYREQREEALRTAVDNSTTAIKEHTQVMAQATAQMGRSERVLTRVEDALDLRNNNKMSRGEHD